MSKQNVERRHFGQLARRLIIQYLLSLLAFTVGLLLFIFLARVLFGSIIWQAEDPLYRLLRFIGNNLVLFGTAAFLAGFVILSCRYIAKAVRCLDEVAAAAQQLASPGEAPILLSPGLKGVQDELNLARAQALQNAFLAKEAEQRKNDLIVYLAHDLKTPLTSVIGYLTLLRDEPQLSEALRARYTGIALDKAERLEELVNEFFDITRFSLSSLTLEPERVSLSRMLEQLMSEFDPILREKQLSWDAQLAPNVEIVCDPDKLGRVFDNLIRNAVAYSYAGSAIRLTLTVLPGQVRIDVQNHGKTIPPDKLGRIFEPFFRLDASRGTATGGAGLGLAIAKEIVELHGGTITAHSEKESILFTVLLPDGRQKIV